VGGEVTHVSRVVLLDGEAVAWMIDVIQADLISARKVKEHLSSRRMARYANAVGPGRPAAGAAPKVCPMAIVDGRHSFGGRRVTWSEPFRALGA
jgi:hypothetical protein